MFSMSSLLNPAGLISNSYIGFWTTSMLLDVFSREVIALRGGCRRCAEVPSPTSSSKRYKFKQVPTRQSQPRQDTKIRGLDSLFPT